MRFDKDSFFSFFSFLWKNLIDSRIIYFEIYLLLEFIKCKCKTLNLDDCISFYRTDAEICGLALEALVNVMTVEEVGGENGTQLTDADLAVQFSEIFLKDPENVTILLTLLEVSVSKIMNLWNVNVCQKGSTNGLFEIFLICYPFLSQQSQKRMTKWTPAIGRL